MSFTTFHNPNSIKRLPPKVGLGGQFTRPILVVPIAVITKRWFD